MKAPGFCNNAHLHIHSICLKVDVSSLTEIWYLQIEPNEKGTQTNEKGTQTNEKGTQTNEKGTQTNESMMLKMLYLYGFAR